MTTFPAPCGVLLALRLAQHGGKAKVSAGAFQAPILNRPLTALAVFCRSRQAEIDQKQTVYKLLTNY